MKRFITILSIFLCISLTMNTITAVAQPKSFPQGIYSIKDLSLMANTPYNVQNISPTSDSFMIVFDSTLRIQQSLHLVPQSSKYTLLPFQYDYLVVIIGKGTLIFS